MSTGPIPDRVATARLFARYGRIDAALPLQSLGRLQSFLADTEGEVSVKLQFGLDAEGRKQLNGVISAVLHLTCQRCLRSLPLQVESELALLVFANRQELEKQLPTGGYDKDLLVLDELQAERLQAEKLQSGSQELGSATEQELDVPALVEDELILSLPMVPLHEDGNCSEAWNSLRESSEAQEREVTQESPSPFAVLAQLKAGKDKGNKS
jgi:uncharacterized protein